MARNGRCIHNRADQNPERNKQDQYKSFHPHVTEHRNKKGERRSWAHVFVSETDISERAQTIGEKKHGRVSLTSLPHICAQYAIPFQCGRSRGKLLVLVDIDRGAQLAELPVKFEHRAVARG